MSFQDHLRSLARGQYGTGRAAQPLRTMPFGPDPVEIYSEETFGPAQVGNGIGLATPDPQQSPTRTQPQQAPIEQPSVLAAPEASNATERALLETPETAPKSEKVQQAPDKDGLQVRPATTPVESHRTIDAAPQRESETAKAPDILSYDAASQIQRVTWEEGTAAPADLPDIGIDPDTNDRPDSRIPDEGPRVYKIEQTSSNPMQNDPVHLSTPLSEQRGPKSDGLSIGELNITVLPPEPIPSAPTPQSPHRGIPISASAARRRAGIGRF